ncbi:MAG: Uma2 family endonuclease [Thermomicrobiales bacterium]|nr:Uma2 family endonuclease [Thermomicrobiales bacterium]
MTATHLVTAEDLLAMGSDAPYELWEGVLKNVSPSSARPSVITLRIASAIMMFADNHRLGFVASSDAGFILNDNPHTVVAPDVGFVRRERLPVGIPVRGFFPIPPDLAVEVISPTDERGDIARKQELYARAGVPLVWWVDPENRTVAVHRLGHDVVVRDEAATLDGGDVLPGFQIDLHRIFDI